MNGGRAAAALVLLLSGGSVAAQAGFGTYGYDKSGNITSVGSDTFRYDAFGRLYTSVLAGFGSQTYTYDRYGNIVRIDRSTDSQAAIPSVDALTNRMNAPFSATGGNLIAQYDAAGNVIEYNQDVFVYDALNMMKETTDPERRLHIYTASDERVVVVTAVNNVETKSEWTLRDAGNRVLRRFEKDTSGWHWKEDYVYGGGRLIAAEVPGSERVRHFHLDHLGTPRLVTGNGGVQLASKTYEPFGPKVNDTTATPAAEPEQLEFTGHERDVPTLDYMHARYYQPYLGRFLSVDPTWASADLGKPQSWNRYTYVLNNPVNYTDPDGRCTAAVIDCVIEGGSVGGLPGALIGAGIGLTLVAGLSQVDVGDFLLSGGGSSGEMAAETMINNFQRQQAARLDLNTPGTQATTGVNPTAPIQAQVVNTTQGPVTIPDDYTSRPADNGKGTVYQPSGASGNADAIRVMDPTTRYPDGYVRIYNEHGQPVNIDGKPLGPAETHLPIVKDTPEQKQ